MTEDATQLYEGMFLFNIQEINGELSTAVDHLREILSRAEAEVVSMSKWDERKLAYPIQGQKRGLYLLSHFRVRPSQVANIERDVNLSELLLRCLIIRGEHLGEPELAAALRATGKLNDELALRGEKAIGDPAAIEAGTAAAEAEEVKEQGPAPETAATVEGGRDESVASASGDESAARPAADGDAPESGTRA